MIIGMIKILIRETAIVLRRLLKEREYRTYLILRARFEDIPRFKECRITLNSWELAVPDAASFLSTYKEIFAEQIYRFQFSAETPRILDLGANIGLSVLYFKQLYPRARITAVEADPRIFAYLKKNIHGNGLEDVTLLNKAVWCENTVIGFTPEGGDGGRVSWPEDIDSVEMETIDIRELLGNGPVDFLKMDIEGAEDAVLPRCRGHLSGIRYIFVEYHSKKGHHQGLDEVMAILSEAGFRLHVQSAFSSSSPFAELRVHSGFDLQLNIFGWRENDY